jgi:hypothetical protein
VREVRMDVPCWGRVLVALRSLPSLTTVSIFGSFCGDTLECGLLGHADLLRSDRPLEADIRYLHLTKSCVDSFQHFCDALKRTKIKSINFQLCELEDEGAIASALASPDSQLEQIKVELSYKFDGGLQFFEAFADGIPAMTRLEELHVCLTGDGFASVETLLRATAQCPRLKKFKLHSGYEVKPDLPDVDQALAHFLQANRGLKSFEFSFRCNNSLATSLPSFLKAMSTNYTIQHLMLKPRPQVHAYSADIRLGNVTFKKTLGTIVQLNRAGRVYMKTDPSNKRKGVQVLEQVKRDLDCFYCHVRENPSLCAS